MDRLKELTGGKTLLFMVDDLDILVKNRLSSKQAIEFASLFVYKAEFTLLGFCSNAPAPDWFRTDKPGGRAPSALETPSPPPPSPEVGVNFLLSLKNVRLAPLSAGEIDLIWSACAREEAPERDPGMLQAIQILSQGLPGRVAAMARAAAPDSQSLAAPFQSLVSSHFQSLCARLDNLPDLERRLIACLNREMRPFGAREAADGAFMDVNKASSLLSRMQKRGFLALALKKGRKKYYELADPLDRWAFAFHQNLRTRDWLQGFVEFLDYFYLTPPNLDNILKEEPDVPAPASRPAIADPGDEPGYGLAFAPQEEPPPTVEAAPPAAPSVPGPPIVPATGLDSLAMPIPPEAPEDASESLKMAWPLLLKADSPSQSQAILRTIVDQEPENARALGLLGDSLGKIAGMEEEAEEVYLLSMEYWAENARAWTGLGRIMARDPSRLVDAEQALRMALGLRPEDAYCLALLGAFMASDPERFSQARRRLEKAVEIAPDLGPAWKFLGELLHERPDTLESCRDAWARALELDPTDTGLWEKYGRVLEKTGQHDAAQFAFKQAREMGSPDSSAATAPPHAVDQSPAQSKDSFPKPADLPVESPAALEKALEQSPDDPALWTRLGYAHFLNRNAQGAEAALKAALEKDPEHAMAQARLGQVYHELTGQADLAEAAFRSAFALEPDEPWAFAHLGQLLTQQPDRLEDAVKALTRALALKPDYVFAQNQLALACLKQGNSQRAQELADEMVLGYVDNYAAIHFGLEFHLFHLPQPKKALHIARDYLRREPDEALAARNLAASFSTWDFDTLPLEISDWFAPVLSGHKTSAPQKPQPAAARPETWLEKAASTLEKETEPAPLLNALVPLCIAAAALGKASDVFSLLKKSPACAKLSRDCQGALAPLVAGLALAAGEDHPACWEIREAAKDVHLQILHEKEQREDSE